MNQNCPFYGRHMVRVGDPFILLGSGGNQCALVTTSHAPCYMEIELKAVNWSQCVRVLELRVELPTPVENK